VTARRPLFAPLVWNQEAIDALGTMPDVKLAKMLSIDPHTVQAKRRVLGIPAYGTPRPWTPEEDAQLGTMSARALGLLLGRTTKAVLARQRQLGIPAWQQPKLRHQGRCVVCGRTFVIRGGRKSQLRKTCPPEHRITQPGRLSAHHKQLISATLMITGRQPKSARGLVKKTVGHGVVDLLGD